MLKAWIILHNDSVLYGLSSVGPGVREREWSSSGRLRAALRWLLGPVASGTLERDAQVRGAVVNL